MLTPVALIILPPPPPVIPHPLQSPGPSLGPKSTGNTRRRRKIFIRLHWTVTWSPPPPPHRGDRPEIGGRGAVPPLNNVMIVYGGDIQFIRTDH